MLLSASSSPMRIARLAVSRKAGSMARGRGNAGTHGSTEQKVCSRQGVPRKWLGLAIGQREY